MRVPSLLPAPSTLDREWQRPRLLTGSVRVRAPQGVPTAPVAQRAEQAAHNRRALGSNPSRSTTNWVWAKGRPPASGAGPWRFESSHPDQREHRPMARTSAFQAGDAGSNPAARSNMCQMPKWSEARDCNPRLTRFESGLALQQSPCSSTAEHSLGKGATADRPRPRAPTHPVQLSLYSMPPWSCCA